MTSQSRSIFRLAFAAASAVCLWIAVQTLLHLSSAWIQAQASLSWPKADGRVISVEPDQSSQRRAGPSLHFRYEYTVSGKRFEGTQLTAGEVIETARLTEFSLQFPAGKEVKVSYDPANPSHAVLVPGPNPGHRILFVVPPVLLGMAACFAWAAMQPRF